MHIGFLLATFPNVYEPYVVDEIIGLQDAGCHVKIFASIPTRGPVHELVSSRNLLDLTTYLRIDSSRMTRLRKSFVPGLRLARAHGTPSKLTHVTSNFELMWNTAYIHDQFKEIRRGEFDIVYCQPGWMGVYAWPTVVPTRSKLVVRFHGLETFRGRQWGSRAVKRYASLMRNGDRFIAPSTYLRDKIVALGAPKDRVFSIPRAVDVDRFRWRPRTLDQNEKLRLISVGRLSPDKGHIYALQAVKMLVQQLDVEYTIVGEGPTRNELQGYVDRHLPGVVTFTGAVNRNAVIDLLHQAHLFVAPSVTDPCGGAESAGTMIREASSSGLPVVASDVGGIPEGILDGETGVLVPERSPPAIAEAILQLVERSNEWPRMAERSRELIRSEFSLSKQIASMLALFESAVADTKGPRSAHST